jgi:hypothetical protein
VSAVFRSVRALEEDPDPFGIATPAPAVSSTGSAVVVSDAQLAAANKQPSA